MTYFDIPKKNAHKCSLPNITGFEPRKGWRCDECGKAYEIISVAQHGESWYEWVRRPEYDIYRSPRDGYFKR